jgi:RHS repeat-associated protein
MSGSQQTVFGFTDEETDSNGLLNLRARYYNPAIGQFFSLDPLETRNRYQYVGANPVNFHDPSGMVDPTDELLIEVASAGGFIQLGLEPGLNRIISSNGINMNAVVEVGSPSITLLSTNPVVQETLSQAQAWNNADFITINNGLVSVPVNAYVQPPATPAQLEAILNGQMAVASMQVIPVPGDTSTPSSSPSTLPPTYQPSDQTKVNNNCDNDCNENMTSAESAQAAVRYADIAKNAYFNPMNASVSGIGGTGILRMVVAVTKVKTIFGKCTEVAAISNSLGKNPRTAWVARWNAARPEFIGIAIGRNAIFYAAATVIQGGALNSGDPVMGHAEYNLYLQVSRMGLEAQQSFRAMGISQEPCFDPGTGIGCRTWLQTHLPNVAVAF